MGRYIATETLADYAADDAVGNLAYIETAIGAAESWIEQYTGRRYTAASAATAATARKFRATGRDVLPIDDCFEVTAISRNGTAVLLADVELEPINGIDQSGAAWPYTGIYYSSGWESWSSSTLLRYPHTITGKWGWPAIPSGIVQAAYILARDELLMRRSFGSGFVGVTDGFGLRAGRNDAVTQLLAKYRRAESWGVA